MRKLAGLVTVVAALVFAAAAGASQPTHTKFSPVVGPFDFPAGTLCDFHYYETDVIEVNELDFGNGRIDLHIESTVTHTNVDTGYTLTETDYYTQTIYPDGTQKLVGLFWHLRNASGKLVLVQAGQVLFDANGVPISYTPNFNPDFAAVACSSLGGNPA
jgi:hypothetical protein